jgi:pimeloyl-ACP methyl ester carboxylesterase
MKHIIFISGLDINYDIYKCMLSMLHQQHKYNITEYFLTSHLITKYDNIVTYLQEEITKVVATDEEQLIFIGHSVGGNICIELSKLFTERCKRCILIEPTCSWNLSYLDSVYSCKINGIVRNLVKISINKNAVEVNRDLYFIMLGQYYNPKNNILHDRRVNNVLDDFKFVSKDNTIFVKSIHKQLLHFPIYHLVKETEKWLLQII